MLSRFSGKNQNFTERPDFSRWFICIWSLSTLYDINDPRRFGMGTPDQVASTMMRC